MKQMKVKRDDDEIDDRDEKVLEYQDGENNEMIILEEFEEDTGNLETRTEQERSIEKDMSDSLHERMDMDGER